MAKFNKSVAALVLNFGKHPFHQGSLGAIRSLGSVGIPVFAIQPSRLIPSGASRYLKRKFYWKTDGKNPGEFLERMASVARVLDRPTVLVPTDDLSAILIAENAGYLPPLFCFPRSPANLPRSLANKRELYELCRRLEIACPATVFPESAEEFRDFAAQAHLPAVVKAINPWLAPPWVRSTALVWERKKLINYCEDRQVPATSVMIQEMIPAPASQDWFVHGYCDRRSNPVVAFTGIKLRSYPPLAGPTTFGCAVRNDFLRQQALDLVKAIAYQGALDLDYKFDKRDGRYKLLDFNPRLGAQFRLFRTAEGTDVVRAMHLDLTGHAPEYGAQVEGRTFASELHDLLAAWAHLRRGDLTWSEWWRSIRAIDETAWYSAKDPLPFLLMCLHMPARALTRHAQHWRLKGAPEITLGTRVLPTVEEGERNPGGWGHEARRAG